jgi:hypothetical protein
MDQHTDATRHVTRYRRCLGIQRGHVVPAQGADSHSREGGIQVRRYRKKDAGYISRAQAISGYKRSEQLLRRCQDRSACIGVRCRRATNSVHRHGPLPLRVIHPMKINKKGVGVNPHALEPLERLIYSSGVMIRPRDRASAA